MKKKTCSIKGEASATRRTSKSLGVTVVAVGTLTLAAACSGSTNYGSSGSNGNAAKSAAPAGEVRVISTPLGKTLTDAAGRTLYSFAADTKSHSNCTESCSVYWPPVRAGSVQATNGVTAKLGMITRSDGTKQLTVNGWPAYTYVGDKAVGDTKGEGLNLSGGLWWVIGKDGHWIKTNTGSASSSSSDSGHGGY